MMNDFECGMETHVKKEMKSEPRFGACTPDKDNYCSIGFQEKA
jgi:hypothetical protein